MIAYVERLGGKSTFLDSVLGSSEMNNWAGLVNILERLMRIPYTLGQNQLNYQFLNIFLKQE